MVAAARAVEARAARAFTAVRLGTHVVALEFTRALFQQPPPTDSASGALDGEDADGGGGGSGGSGGGGDSNDSNGGAVGGMGGAGARLGRPATWGALSSSSLWLLAALMSSLLSTGPVARRGFVAAELEREGLRALFASEPGLRAQQRGKIREEVGACLALLDQAGGATSGQAEVAAVGAEAETRTEVGADTAEAAEAAAAVEAAAEEGEADTAADAATEALAEMAAAAEEDTVDAPRLSKGREHSEREIMLSSKQSEGEVAQEQQRHAARGYHAEDAVAPAASRRRRGWQKRGEGNIAGGGNPTTAAAAAETAAIETGIAAGVSDEELERCVAVLAARVYTRPLISST